MSGAPLKLPYDPRIAFFFDDDDEEEEEVCSKCGATEAKFKCSRCRSVLYCTKQCQEKHWPLHKKICKKQTVQEAGILLYKNTLLYKNIELYNASRGGDLPTVTAMITEGADVNWADPKTRDGITALFVASEKGHLPVVNALIAARAVVDQVSAIGRTALMHAAQNGHEAVVDTLHRLAGTSVLHADNEGGTALHTAAQHGRPGVVRYLLRAGANPNAVSTNICGVTPLILASQMNHPEAVQALIEASANVYYSRPSDQITSLILAAQEGHIEVVRALIAA